MVPFRKTLLTLGFNEQLESDIILNLLRIELYSRPEAFQEIADSFHK